ncbi:hypothetical protein [Xylophilus ampelinus]|uniref:Uncharacterized protein n=1 Tax=Xylophilus ampelinus TaxID=54067 RepID=A0A318SKL5_9BURK|nr:hypothetical protein [Xylophilus ampelinus]MCS4510885.1 hypothetical protein [Xylophilus ampelinus]PYE76042.1 hypothetical protein DFQ15_1162 [Xylophilus ampelinus]
MDPFDPIFSLLMTWLWAVIAVVSVAMVALVWWEMRKKARRKLERAYGMKRGEMDRW